MPRLIPIDLVILDSHKCAAEVKKVGSVRRGSMVYDTHTPPPAGSYPGLARSACMVSALIFGYRVMVASIIGVT